MALQRETQLNIGVGELLGYYENMGKLVAFPVPNGMDIAGNAEETPAQVVDRMKRLYLLRPGVWDWVVIVRGGACGVIELKSVDGRLSTDQRIFGAQLEMIGCQKAVCRTIDDVKRTVDLWCAPPVREPAVDGMASR